MNLTPGRDFAESLRGKTWQEVVGEVQFQEAAKAAMLEYASELTSSTPAEAGFRLQGAQGFLRKLMSISENREPQPRKDYLNLT